MRFILETAGEKAARISHLSKEEGIGGEDLDIVFTVITRLEVRRLKSVVYILDPKAFVFTHTIREAAGGVLKWHLNH